MLVLFDFDGTLVDSRRRVLAAMGRAYDDHRVARPTDAAILSTVGLQPADMLADLSPKLAADLRHTIAEAYKAHSLALREAEPDAERPFPGARETLVTLGAAGHRLGVVTGKSADGLAQSLAQLGWQGLFDDLRPADGAPGKPDPTLIRRAMGATGMGPAETVMIGDTSFDMIMAGRAGVQGVGVAWGYHAPERLVEAGAGAIIETFAELGTHLQQA